MLVRLFAVIILFIDSSEGFAGFLSVSPKKPTHIAPSFTNLHYFRHALPSFVKNTPRVGLLHMNSDPPSGSDSKGAVKDADPASDTRRFLVAGVLSLLVSIPVSFLIEFLGKEQEPGPPEIQVFTNVDEDFLSKRRVRQWDIWESSSVPSNKFDYTYEKTEAVYILEGEAVVTPKDGRKAVVLKPNVFASFPKGLSCVWEVKTPVRKFYKEYNAILSFE
jgi:uncharacterized cupin superfamily protein